MNSETGPSTPSSSGKGGFVPPSTGDLDAIFANYEFIDLLGRGGMGAVYKARQKSLDRLVAIKILPPSLVQDAEETSFHFAERFQREARAMAKLSHPNIIAVYDFGQASDGQFYFVMEYIEGTDLHALIQGGQLTPDHVAGWISQICNALQYAHAKGIVHRDIKPSNIMITLEGQVKVADFGLAKLTGAGEVESKLTMTNMAMGTPDYVAPEALEMGVEVDHRADLYAVGVMLYEMLTGKVPRGAWKSPSTQIPGLDPRYDKLIERAMDADREDRHQQASEISATIYEISTTPAKPAAGQRRTLLVGDAAGIGPVKPSVSPSAAGAETPPSKGRASSISPPRPELKATSPVGLTAAIVSGSVALGLAVFFISRPATEPMPPLDSTILSPGIVNVGGSSRPEQPAANTTPPSTSPKADLGGPEPDPVEIPAPLIFGGHRYQFVPGTLSWQEAKAKAESMGGHLAFVTTKAEHDWVAQTIARTHLKTEFHSFWIGGRKASSSEPWRWIDGTEITDFWKDGDFGDVETYPDRGTFPAFLSYFMRGNTVALDDKSNSAAPQKHWSNDIVGFLVEWGNNLPSVSPALSAPSAPKQTLDLLALIDSVKDRGVASVFSGKNEWVREGKTLVFKSDDKGGKIAAPVALTSRDYEMELLAERLSGRDRINLDLPRPGGQLPLAFNVPGHKVINGKEGNPWTGTGSVVHVVVRVTMSGDGKSDHIVITRKDTGESLADWRGSMTSMGISGESHPEFPGEPFTSLFVMKDSYVIKKWTLRLYDGEVKVLRPSSTPIPTAPAPAVSDDPVSLKLVELEKTFLTTYETQVTPKHTAAVATLNSNYLAKLDRDIAAASQAGKLDEALSLREEKTQIETHGTVPAEDSADLPAVLAPLRNTYRATLSTLLSNRDQLAAPLHAAYDRALATYQDELTRDQKLDEATRVKAVRDHAASRRESKPEPVTLAGSTTASPPPVGQTTATLPPPPVAPPLTADKILPPPPKPSQEDITALANWILNDRNGTVTVLEGDSRREFEKGTALPRGALKVVAINFYTFPNDEPSRKFLDLLGSLPDLESLSIKEFSSTFPIASLRGLTKLKSLTLGLGKIEDSGFAHLSGLTELTRIHFDRINGFTGTGLGYLSDGLTSLLLHGCPHLSAEGLAFLPRFRTLNTLSLEDSKGFTDEALRPLAGLPELQTLVILGTPLEGSFLSSLPDNSKIKTIGLSETAKFLPQNLNHLGKMKQLETLSLPPLDPPAEAMVSIASLGSLREIGFHVPFTGETLAGVKGFRSLEKIYIDKCSITDAGWAAIAESMPNLKDLSFARFADSKGPVSASAMGEHLGKLRSLTSVSAIHSGITDEWMPAIAKLKSVRRLSLQGAGLTDAGLVALQDMEITHLIIRQTSLTDAAVPTLKRFPALRSGEFHQTKITDPVRAEFAEFLKGRAE